MLYVYKLNFGGLRRKLRYKLTKIMQLVFEYRCFTIHGKTGPDMTFHDFQKSSATRSYVSKRQGKFHCELITICFYISSFCIDIIVDFTNEKSTLCDYRHFLRARQWLAKSWSGELDLIIYNVSIVSSML